VTDAGQANVGAPLNAGEPVNFGEQSLASS
jgi:hypothetical protein